MVLSWIETINWTIEACEMDADDRTNIGYGATTHEYMPQMEGGRNEQYPIIVDDILGQNSGHEPSSVMGGCNSITCTLWILNYRYVTRWNGT